MPAARCAVKGAPCGKPAKLKKWKGPASRRLSPAAGSLQRTRMAAVFLIALIALLSLFLLLYIVPLYFATVFYCTKATQAFIPAQFFSYAGIFYYLLSYSCTVFQIVYMFGGLFTISLYPWLANRRIICYNMKLLIGSSFKSQVNTRAFAPWLEVRSGNKTFSVPKSAGALGVFFLFGPSFHSACFFRLS